MDSHKLALFALGMALITGAVCDGALAAGGATPSEPGAIEEGMPWPPDGVTDPNVEYPTDGTDGISEGEMAVERNGVGAADQSPDDDEDAPADDGTAPEHVSD